MVYGLPVTGFAPMVYLIVAATLVVSGVIIRFGSKVRAMFSSKRK